MVKQASISKSMSKVESKTHMGASYQWWSILTAWLVGSLILLHPIANRTIVPPYSFIIYFILITWWIIFVTYFRNTQRQVRTWLHVKFMYRVYTGKSITMKYVVPLRVLENIIPTKSVHENGLIKFKYGYWGMLVDVISNHIDNTDLPYHLELITKALDSIHDDITIKIISSSYVDYRNDLELELLNLSNDTSKTDPQREHLYYLYEDLKRKQDENISWNTVIFIDYGKHKTLESAELKRQEFLPGFKDGLKRADTYCVPVTDESQITQLYKRLIMVRL